APPSGAGLADAPLPADTESAVVVIGHGRVGSLLCRLMRQQDMPFIAFDTNPQTVAAARRAGESVYYANAGRSDLLHRIGIQRAAMAVITIDDPDAAEQIAATIRRLAPEIVILARARDLAHALKLEKAGATKAVPETLESSLQLASSLLTTAGIPEEALPGLIEPLRSYEWHHPEDERPN
ncbi:MAG: hypothetical protein FJX47_20180, partial [Alphaproteobacteria bacterium]|nr:hypothetical protein [Alphaproteobacteria bacterium]